MLAKKPSKNKVIARRKIPTIATPFGVFLFCNDLIDIGMHTPIIHRNLVFKNSIGIVFCFPNCSDLLWEKIVLKTGSDEIIHWIGRYSFLMGFIMSKNIRGCILNFRLEYKIINFLVFFDIFNKKPEGKRQAKSKNLGGKY